MLSHYLIPFPSKKSKICSQIFETLTHQATAVQVQRELGRPLRLVFLSIGNTKVWFRLVNEFIAKVLFKFFSSLNIVGNGLNKSPFFFLFLEKFGEVCLKRFGIFLALLFFCYHKIKLFFHVCQFQREKHSTLWLLLRTMILLNDPVLCSLCHSGFEVQESTKQQNQRQYKKNVDLVLFFCFFIPRAENGKESAFNGFVRTIPLASWKNVVPSGIQIFLCFFGFRQESKSAQRVNQVKSVINNNHKSITSFPWTLSKRLTPVTVQEWLNSHDLRTLFGNLLLKRLDYLS